MSVVEIRILRWMCGKTRKDKVINEDIHHQIGIAPIEDKLREPFTVVWPHRTWIKGWTC